jgi:hypothetical protein
MIMNGEHCIFEKPLDSAMLFSYSKDTEKEFLSRRL